MSLYHVKLPTLAVGMEEGVVLDWLVSVGEDVARDQRLCVVEADKVNVDLESPVAGRIVELHAEPGATVPVGVTLATLDVSDS
jgi:pyruvate/2-oxoglutarate dehydrogenase complex dihydrolipoamide acyltransferase (E2) component